MKDPTSGIELTCRECGAQDTTSYDPPTNKGMADGKLCFTCLFWTEKIRDWAPNWVVVNGGGYALNKATADTPFPRGFGGRVFHVRRKGEVRAKDYDNVWFFGDIPAHFRERLPDTAEFLWPEGPKKVLDTITFEVWKDGGNYKQMREFCGPVPPCEQCGGTGEYEGEDGPKACMPCNSRLFFFVDAAGKRVGADDGDIIEKTDRGLYLLPQNRHG